MASSSLYREHRVFGYRSEVLVLFICFERLEDQTFAVAQAEFLYEEDDYQKRLAEIGENTLMLLIDRETIAEWDFLPTIEEAIVAHEEAFEGLIEQVTNAHHH